MIISKCKKCGKLIHNSERCFFCGNTSEFEKEYSTINIHENVKNEYEHLEQLVIKGEFDEALKLSKFILEWMPFCSDVFWLRFLAKNKCSTDEDLVRKGACCEESADYYNAVLFASKEQKNVYDNVASTISDVRDVLIEYIKEHEYIEKKNTSIIKIQSELLDEIEDYKKNILELWKSLKDIENQMMIVEKDCLLLINEYKETLEKANSKAASIKANAYKIEQCYAEDLYKYEIQFKDLLSQSEQARATISSMRVEHPCIKNYNELKEKRDYKKSQIDKEIERFKERKKSVRTVIFKVEDIEAKHTEALNSVTNYKFTEAYNLLGESCFTDAFVKSGVI